ncbi:MAG: hypothetical protein ACREP7_19295 [Lysobacter sp.]
MELLHSDRIVVLSKRQLAQSFPVAAGALTDSTHYWLVRAFANPVNSRYSVGYNEGVLTISYIAMGGCGSLVRGAFVVAVDGSVEQVYSHCSGVM